MSVLRVGDDVPARATGLHATLSPPEADPGQSTRLSCHDSPTKMGSIPIHGASRMSELRFSVGALKAVNPGVAFTGLPKGAGTSLWRVRAELRQECHRVVMGEVAQGRDRVPR